VNVVIYRDPSGPVRSGDTAHISISVKHPPADATYRWRAAGDFSPQETTSLETVYRAPLNGSRTDQAILEVLSNGNVVYTKPFTIPLAIDAPADSLANTEIEITEKPPFEPSGGATTKANIAGRVKGISFSEHKLVIYACTSECFVQPLIDSPMTDINDDGTWSNWTHTGALYAVLVVPSTFRPKPVLSSPNEEINSVIGRVVFEGKR
jgi:hypothetical protein